MEEKRKNGQPQPGLPYRNQPEVIPSPDPIEPVRPEENPYEAPEENPYKMPPVEIPLG